LTVFAGGQLVAETTIDHFKHANPVSLDEGALELLREVSAL